MASEYFEIAEYGHQQVVEIVSHTSGQLPDGFDLLGLHQLLLGLFSLLHLDDGAGVRLLKRSGSFGHAPFRDSR